MFIRVLTSARDGPRGRDGAAVAEPAARPPPHEPTAGFRRCAGCGYEIAVRGTPPVCPECGGTRWARVRARSRSSPL